MTRHPWPCADRQCQSDQHYHTRDGVRGAPGRKVISHFFGRNKRETKRIHEEVWHWGCRKLYQRGKYNADKDKGSPRLCNHFMSLLREQIIRIQLWRPESTFKVQLQEPAKQRLQQYHGILSRNGGDKHSAKRQMTVAPKTGTSGKPIDLSDVEAVEMDHAEHIDAQLSGTSESIAYLLNTVLPWIESEVEAGRMTRMPPIEFLINEPKPGDTFTNPENNYDRWTAQQDGVEYKSPTVKAATPPKRKATTTKASSSRPPIDHRPPPKIKLTFNKTKKAATETPDATSSTSDITDPESRHSTSPPPSPLANKGKGKQRASGAKELPLYVPPAPITTNKRKRSPADDLPLYVPPPPIAIPSIERSPTHPPPPAKKQRPSPINTALANTTKKPTCTDQPSGSDSSLTSFESECEHEQNQSAYTDHPESAFTEIEESPRRIRGMVYASGKKRKVLREEQPTSALTTLESERPESAFTEIEESPRRIRGMVYASGKKRKVLRDEVDDED